MRLGILTSHPIQYQAPWFRALAREVQVEVFFAHQPGAAQQGEGFGKAFKWDVDLLSGYSHHFLKNVSRTPGVNRFSGCDTPEIVEIIQKTESRKQKAEMDEKNFHVSSFDAFIVNGWHLKSYWQAVRACRRAGVPVFVRGDSQLLTPRSRLKTWSKTLTYRVLLRQFDGFLTVGQRNAEYLAHYGVPERKMFPVPHFVDNEWFREKAEKLKNEKAKIRKGFGIPEEAFCVLFCGKFAAKKRPLDLVKAATRLMAPGSKLSNLHLLFVGSGEMGAELRKNCQVVFDVEQEKPETRNQKPEFPNASFAGFKNQTELPACYAAADVLVLPSDGGETWGLVVNEAMACRLPAIVSDAVGCAPDLIDEGRTGFIYPMGDVAALADRLSRISEMRDQGLDFAADLRKKLESYSVEAAVHGTLNAIS